jgi:hypothetical protein
MQNTTAAVAASMDRNNRYLMPSFIMVFRLQQEFIFFLPQFRPEKHRQPLPSGNFHISSIFAPHLRGIH